MLLKRISLLVFLAAAPCFATLNPGVQWEVRVGGLSTNGGGFDPTVTSPGTDYTQQLTPQFSYTDLVIGATNTQLTSAAHPFDATTVGNIVHVSAGTGFTTGWYEILSVSANVATMDRAVGTASSTGGSGVLGGALDLWQNVPLYTNGVGATYPNGNTIWIRSGTYTYTSSFVGSGNGPQYVSMIGYATTHGDNGTSPLLTTSSTSVTPFQTLGPSNGSAYYLNLKITCPTSGSTVDCVLGQQISNAFFNSVEVQGGLIGIEAKESTIINNSYVHNASTYNVFSNTNNLIKMYNSIISGASSDGMRFTSTAQLYDIQNCIFASNGGNGINWTAAPTWVFLANNDFYGNTTNGVSLGSPSAGGVLFANVFYGNGGWGLTINSAWSGLNFGTNAYNAFGANTSGAQQYLNAGIGTVTLTGNPFISPGANNFALNSTAGAGALLKGTAGAGMFLNHTAGTTTSLDIGAVQSGGGGGSSVLANSGYAN